MKHEPHNQDSDLPDRLSQPARRALINAGFLRLEQLAGLRTAELKQLHGMGPKGIEQLRRALAERGLTLADERA